MNGKKATGLLLIWTIVTVLLSATGAIGEENLLSNANFQELDEDGYPEGWYIDAYIFEPGYTVFEVGEDAAHQRVLDITNIAQNDARFAQTVEVEPNALYCLSGDILADHINGGHGANLSVEGIYAFSEKVYETNGEWKHIEYYGETGSNQEYITVFARLGGYSGESTGHASFRNLSLTKAESIPGDAVADLWYRETDSVDDINEEMDDHPFWPFLLLISLFYALAFCFTICFLRRLNVSDSPLLKDRSSSVWKAVMVLLLSLLLRLVLSANILGYMVDVNCFLSWGHTFATVGPSNFYEATNFCDYPPLYTWILGLNSLVSGWLGSGAVVDRMIFRFIPSLCDLAACFLLWRMLLKKNPTAVQEALLFLTFLAFNPAMILNSSAWGQMDSVLCLLLMMVAHLAIDMRWTFALPLYVISVLIKPQALMLGPLGLTFIIQSYVQRKQERKSIWIGTGIGIAVLLAGVIPFSLHQKWDWLIQLYAKTLGSYPYATVNTANIYYLLGANWQGIEADAGIWPGLILGILCLCYGAWWLHRGGKMRGCRVEAVLSVLFAAAFILLAFVGTNWMAIGTMAMFFAFVIVLAIALRSSKKEMLCFLGALLYILLYVFGIKMHERYLFPALLLLAAAWIGLKDRRILYLMVLFTTILFVNEGIVLDNSIRLGSSMGHLNKDTVWLADTLSILNILGALYAVYLSIEILLNRAPAELKTSVSSNTSRKRIHFRQWTFDRSLHWNWKDTVILTVITCVFAAVSLLSLGSTKAPQTSWTASSDEEEVIFDLGEYREQFAILYFGQVSRKDFSFAVSDDGETWSPETWAQMNEGQCWKWKYVTEYYVNTTDSEDIADSSRIYYNSDLDHVKLFSGRYVRLSAHHLGLTLNEVIFRDPVGNLLPVRVIDRQGAFPNSELYAAPDCLLDEQDTLEGLPVYFGGTDIYPAQPSWWNSTYFDEIYHARTAFEFTQGTRPYETSHPPLGKVLMSFCVSLLGMTPFGWRFAGALAGVLMLPGMYLLAKQLSKKTSIATLACLFMALDCMHLTQSQIATIDSFPVLFIIFSYFFMLRFLQTDWLREEMKHVLLNLAASGLFMGLSIASKWIGIYAGGGLAILFFWHLWRTYRIHVKAEETLARANANSPMHREASEFLLDRPAATTAFHRMLQLCLWCVLFFILLPIAIYLLSYLPYLAYARNRIHGIGTYITEVWKAQIGMFNYHSTQNLGMDHPFYSPWWEWPVIGKPMYYAAEQYLPVNSVLHYSIFCIGNPVIWYAGLASLVFFAVITARQAVRQPKESDLSAPEACHWVLKANPSDPRIMFLFIGILAQYLPWVLVPRGTYIYHYFASLPFLMLCLSLCFDGWTGIPSRRLRLIEGAFILLVLGSFIVFFPYASGLYASASWMDIGKGLLRIWY